jgi:hypothetical protein
MILVTTLLLPFVMLGLLFALQWIEDRYLPPSGDGPEQDAADLEGRFRPRPVHADSRVVVRRRRHRARAGVVTGRHPPGRRTDPHRA